MRVFLLGLALGLAGEGCSDRPRSAPSSPDAPARKTEPAGVSADRSWTQAPFCFIQTALSPATLFHSRGKTISFFTQLAEAGLGAPTFAVFNSEMGPRPVKNGSPIAPATMRECWVLVWFAGARGWTNWDSPWVVCLQHIPAAMRLDDGGLHFEFEKEAGYVALLPLYGCAQPPQKGVALTATDGLPEKGLRTWEWENRIPKEIFHRVRYWASALREFPMAREQTVRLDLAHGTATIRSRFEWISIADEWQTAPLKLALLDPALALAAKEKPSPVTFSRRIYDLELLTAGGPCLGVQDADLFDATFPARGDAIEAEAGPRPLTNAPAIVRAMLEKWRQAGRTKFRLPDQPGDAAASLGPPIHWQQRDEAGAAATLAWPEVMAWDWKTASGARWTFGSVKPAAPAGPASVKVVPLNADTRMVVFELK